MRTITDSEAEIQIIQSFDMTADKYSTEHFWWHRDKQMHTSNKLYSQMLNAQFNLDMWSAYRLMSVVAHFSNVMQCNTQ